MAIDTLNELNKIARKNVRAFTLIEVVIAVIVLSIAVPPTLNLLGSTSAGRVNAIHTTRATFLSTSVLETVLADMTSNQAFLGFDALNDAQAYLTTANTGLYARLSGLTQYYQDVGLRYTVTIGELVSSDGQVSQSQNENIFRTVTVIVEFEGSDGSQMTMPTSLMVSEM